MPDVVVDSDSDPVVIILRSLSAICDEYAVQRHDQQPDGALDATLRTVLSGDDFLAVTEFHAGLKDDEYGLSAEVGGRFLYARLVNTVETYYEGQRER